MERLKLMFLHLVEHNLTNISWSMKANFTVNPTYHVTPLQKRPENGPELLSLLVYKEDSSGMDAFT